MVPLYPEQGILYSAEQPDLEEDVSGMGDVFESLYASLTKTKTALQWRMAQVPHVDYQTILLNLVK